MFQQDLFKGKRVLVTGGGSGIGYAIARMFLEHGGQVYIASRRRERLDVAVQSLSAYGLVQARVLDIRDTDQLASFSDWLSSCGGLDILVNNAGGQFPGPAEDCTHRGWQAVINNNLNGTWYVTQEMARRFFIPQGSGRVINIVMNNYRGFPGMAHSAAARAGVMNLTRTLAVEWANRGIRINCIAPGVIRSSGLEQYPASLVAGVAEKIPLKRLGLVEEVAALVLFLASPLGSYITGETVYIDGGARLWGDVWEIEST